MALVIDGEAGARGVEEEVNLAPAKGEIY